MLKSISTRNVILQHFSFLLDKNNFFKKNSIAINSLGNFLHHRILLLYCLILIINKSADGFFTSAQFPKPFFVESIEQKNIRISYFKPTISLTKSKILLEEEYYKVLGISIFFSFASTKTNQ